MMLIVKRLLLAAILGSVFAQPGAAQTSLFDGARLISMCEQGTCVRGLQATVGQVLLQRLPPEEFNSQLGVIAALLFQASLGARPEMVAQLAEALRALALYSTDPLQRDSFVLVAGQIQAGTSELFDLDAPFAVSPS